jgi:hypothetical protein
MVENLQSWRILAYFIHIISSDKEGFWKSPHKRSISIGKSYPKLIEYFYNLGYWQGILDFQNICFIYFESCKSWIKGLQEQ